MFYNNYKWNIHLKLLITISYTCNIKYYTTILQYKKFFLIKENLSHMPKDPKVWMAPENVNSEVLHASPTSGSCHLLSLLASSRGHKVATTIPGLHRNMAISEQRGGCCLCGSQFSDEKTFSPSPRPPYLPYSSPLQTFPSLSQQQGTYTSTIRNQLDPPKSFRGEGQGTKISLLPVRGRSGFWMTTTRDCHSKLCPSSEEPALRVSHTSVYP